MSSSPNILLIISGSISAYKSLELIRLMRKKSMRIQTILTQGGEKFITPLSAAALSESFVYTDLWSLKDETEMGHIGLARQAELIILAPASANLLAKMAHGMADDLASTTLLAADIPILIAPAMNPKMWENPATQANISRLQERGVRQIGPCQGETACGETGPGRMAEPEMILETALTMLDRPPPLSAPSDTSSKLLKGYKALVTAGPTHEPIDPVRFLANRSSGKQGYAIASQLATAGAKVTLVTGPTSLPPPENVQVIKVQTTEKMKQACLKTLPVDIAICAAAPLDWQIDTPAQNKMKKKPHVSAPVLHLSETPDILREISNHPTSRPHLVVGFAAETEQLIKHARQKLKRKGCDWILANEVGQEKGFGTADNKIYFIGHDRCEEWPFMPKETIAQHLIIKIKEELTDNDQLQAAE